MSNRGGFLEKSRLAVALLMCCFGFVATGVVSKRCGARHINGTEVSQICDEVSSCVFAGAAA